ncbi:MAG: DUF3667 domain-containing protein [Kordiimonadaceae bacterium]|nr:DUF3667 domain-containing protein [Kordiimonadaceae bacterium]MBO6567690.1 DUF3667 domain-containing protein [Kordiimonadaceae bacterium]MBO6963096.1 DUF3667 domain-containing protein [Kordiimonadaceae bacterium]
MAMGTNTAGESEWTCASCGTSARGNFCWNCGERQFGPNQRRLRVLFGQLFEEVTSLDSKFARTLRAFFLRPGFLSREHYRGARKAYMRPFTLFLLINLLYFLRAPLTDFALPLDNQELQPYGSWVQGIIEAYLTTTGQTFEDVATRYDSVTGIVAKSIVIVGVPFLIPFVWLVNLGNRYFLIDHAVFAIHFYSFVLAWPLIFALLAGAVYNLGGPFVIESPMVAGLLLLGPMVVYLTIAQKTMYEDPVWRAGIKAVVMSLGFVVSHFVYRLIQFWLVWWQVT